MIYKTSKVHTRLLLKEQNPGTPLKRNPTGNREKKVNQQNQLQIRAWARTIINLKGYNNSCEPVYNERLTILHM